MRRRPELELLAERIRQRVEATLLECRPACGFSADEAEAVDAAILNELEQFAEERER